MPLFTLVAIGTFVEYLSYAGTLPFLSQKLPVGVFLNAVVSLLGLIVFVKFGAEASPAARQSARYYCFTCNNYLI